MPATNPDGAYSRDFLLWEARQATRATGRDLVDTARRLRRVLGAPDTAQTATVLAAADLRAETSTLVAALRQAHLDASAAFFGAIVDLADLDPAMDMRPALPA